MDSKVVRADFGSGLICPWAQTCCAELRRLARLANSPGFKSFRCPRWRIKFSLERFSDSVAISFACPAVGKFSRASSAGGRRHLRSNFVNRIVSVAEDCLSPERTFHGCTLMQFRCSFPLLVSVARFLCSNPPTHFPTDFARSTKKAYSSATCFRRLNLPELPPCPASILMRNNSGF
jgi:hypothetical protein